MPECDGDDGWGEDGEWVTYPQYKEREEKKRMERQTRQFNPEDRHEVFNIPGWEASVTMYPLKKGETFREIRTVMCKGNGRLIIQSQDDIDELRSFLNAVESLAKTGRKLVTDKKEFNRFSDIEVV